MTSAKLPVVDGWKIDIPRKTLTDHDDGVIVRFEGDPSSPRSPVVVSPAPMDPDQQTLDGAPERYREMVRDHDERKIRSALKALAQHLRDSR